MERAMTDHVVRTVDSKDPCTNLTELNDTELSTATGGKGRVAHSDLNIQKYVDKASPKLF
jgi:type VI protein secretion system component Hcp